MFKQFLNLVFLLTLGTTLGLFYVAGKVEPIVVSYEIRSTEKQLATEHERMKNHEYRLASLKSPSRLETQMANTGLELVPVREVKVLKFIPAQLPQPQPAALNPVTSHGGFLSVREAHAKSDTR